MASTRPQRDANPRQDCLHPDSHGAGPRTHAPRRGCAWGRGVWTSAEAGVKCSVMSGATATAACETGDAEQREGARGGDGGGEVADLNVSTAVRGEEEIHKVD